MVLVGDVGGIKTILALSEPVGFARSHNDLGWRESRVIVTQGGRADFAPAINSK
jgi:glucokinase